ncbi:MAG: hypothetical protein N2035_07615 [Chthoniobacterales bacterium]|nr:hypothetical protein [Chthoniobacterales bacterium]
MLLLRSSFSLKNKSAFTILEICLSLGIAALLLGIFIPSTQVWILERNLRKELERFANEVNSLRIQTLHSAEPQIIHFLNSRQAQKATKATFHTFIIPNELRLLRQTKNGNWVDVSNSYFIIDAGGIVSPTKFRLEKKSHQITFSFHPLTGHLQESEFSF